MAGVTETQSLRYGHVTDVISHTMMRDLADDIAVQLDAADAARAVALKRPQARSHRNATASLAAATPTAQVFDTLVWDTHGMINIGAQPTRITVVTAAGVGSYHVTGWAQCDTTSWTRADLSIAKNGTAIRARTWFQPVILDVLSVEAIVDMNTVGDYFTLILSHEGGGSTTIYEVDLSVQKITTN